MVGSRTSQPWSAPSGRGRAAAGACRTATAGRPSAVYVDDVVAGWCSIAPREDYRRILRSRTIPAPDIGGVWCAVCFVVRAGFRKHGLMHALLAGAVDHAARHGAAAIEGYPADTSGGRLDVVSGYVGSVALFERGGFVRASETTSKSGGRPRLVMRRTLLSDTSER